MSNPEPKRTHTEPAQPAKPMTPGRILKALTIGPTLSAARELGRGGITIHRAFRYPFRNLPALFEEAREDRKASLESPEGLWDDIVITAKVTERSLRSRYRLAYWLDMLLLCVLAMGLGFTLRNLAANAQTVVSLVLCNLLLIAHFSQIYKLYIAREQRLITGAQLFKLLLRSPSLWLPQPLPADYALRKPAPPRQPDGSAEEAI